MSVTTASHADVPLLEVVSRTIALNYDVLLEIISFLDRASMSRAMRTCRALYLGGVPYLLRGRVAIYSRAKMISLCGFMFRDMTRFRYLRCLSSYMPGAFKLQSKVDLVAAFFKYAHHLETLEIFRCNFFDQDGKIATAISSLPALRCLTLHSLTESAFHLLNNLHNAPLTRVEICFYGDDVDGPIDPVPILRSLRERLEDLHVTWVEFDDTTVQYPAIRSLTVDDCRFAMLSPIVHCFPNVRNVTMWMGQEDDHLADEEIEEQREINRAANIWKSLEELAGSVLSLYMLAVQCPVDRLVMASDRLQLGYCEMLSTILADVRPAALTMPRIDVSRIDISIFRDMLAPLLGRLTSLSVDMEFEDQSTGFMEAISDLIVAVKGHNLRSLFINIDWSPNRVLDSNEQPIHDRDLSGYLRAYRAEDLGCLARDRLPCLRWLYIYSYSSFRHAVNVAYEIVSEMDSNGKELRLLRKMQDKEGERVMRRELRQLEFTDQDD